MSEEGPPLHLLRRVSRKAVGQERGLCIVEGWKCIREALKKTSLETLLAASELRDTHEMALRELAGSHPLHWVDGRELARVTSTSTPEGVVAMVQRPLILSELHEAPGRLQVVLYRWQDPSNVGALVRAARGLGVASVAMWGPGPDFFSARVIRASMGSVFHLPLATLAETWIPSHLWIDLWADARGSPDIPALDPARSTVLIMGSESHGLPDMAADRRTLALKMCGGLESFSAPIAASLFIERLLSPKPLSSNRRGL